MSDTTNFLKTEALKYHRAYPGGKLAIKPTKSLTTQLDLSLAYSPGVAYACEAIKDDPIEANALTARGNLVAVISNGTAVLGLGHIGALASKPVMEGKAVLFKKFADIDVFDVEVNETDCDKFCDIVESLEPTFGGINLEDIKAPDCFYIEERLRKNMNIPVFHDDQHGTAIIVGAAVINALHLSHKNIADVKIVSSGAGAAALACLNFLISMGANKKNITITDREGVVYKGRNTNIDKYKMAFAREDQTIKTLDDAIVDCDIFLGLSTGNILKEHMVKAMAPHPLILALSNPTPEIQPELVKSIRDDAIICTGRSDYNNQVNNVLCFPFIFRGALDVGAQMINEDMKIAAAKTIADMARKGVNDTISKVYRNETLSFGSEYIIPKPLDPRLVIEVSLAVAKSAVKSGVATKNIDDWEQYEHNLERFMSKSSQTMRPIFDIASKNPRKVVLCEGEDDRTLHALSTIIEHHYAHPILIGRRAVIEKRLSTINPGHHFHKSFDILDPEDNPFFEESWKLYHDIMGRSGVSSDFSRTIVRTKSTVLGALMVRQHHADAVLCGTVGAHQRHMRHIREIIGHKPNLYSFYAMSILFVDNAPIFLLDTHINYEPNKDQIVEMTKLAIEKVKIFGLQPRVALLAHSNFGSSQHPSAIKMKEATAILQHDLPDVAIEGEMHADTAFDNEFRQSVLSNHKLDDEPNILVFPNLDSANITYGLLKIKSSSGIVIGPILLGGNHSAHVLPISASSRSIVNMCAYASSEAT